MLGVNNKLRRVSGQMDAIGSESTDPKMPTPLSCPPEPPGSRAAVFLGGWVLAPGAETSGGRFFVKIWVGLLEGSRWWELRATKKHVAGIAEHSPRFPRFGFGTDHSD